MEHGARQFGIARQHVLAACVQVEEGLATDRLIRVPTDELKVVAIRERIGKPVDVALGNSVHDQAMLETARYPICVNPNADLEQIARERGWPVYWPAGTRNQSEPEIVALSLRVRRKAVEIVLQLFFRNRKQIDPALQRQRVHRQVIAPDGEPQTNAASLLRA